MYQLRFLIATPRKMAPHVFCHREFRGQRTQQDDFHSGFNTFVCPAKGDKSSQDIMLELFQSAAAHQPNSHLFPLVELFDPETRERIKLAGNEIVLRPSDLQAAQEAISAQHPLATLAQNQIDLTPEQSSIADAVLTETLTSNCPSSPLPLLPASTLSVLDRVQTEITANGKATATQLAVTLGIDAADIKAAVSEPDSGLQNKGGWISVI